MAFIPLVQRKSKRRALQKHFRPAKVSPQPPADTCAGDIQGSLQQRMARICRPREAPWPRFPGRGCIQNRLGSSQTSIRERRRWRLAQEITFQFLSIFQNTFTVSVVPPDCWYANNYIGLH